MAAPENSFASSAATLCFYSSFRFPRRFHTARIKKPIHQIIDGDELIQDLELRREQGRLQGAAGSATACMRMFRSAGVPLQLVQRNPEQRIQMEFEIMQKQQLPFCH